MAVGFKARGGKKGGTEEFWQEFSAGSCWCL